MFLSLHDLSVCPRLSFLFRNQLLTKVSKEEKSPTHSRPILIPPVDMGVEFDLHIQIQPDLDFETRILLGFIVSHFATPSDQPSGQVCGLVFRYQPTCSFSLSASEGSCRIDIFDRSVVDM